MSINNDALDRIKAAAANTIAWELGDDGRELADKVLAEIDKAAAAEAHPFAVGSRVTIVSTGITGTVVRRVENGGELHTLAVVLDLATAPGERLFSPRELDEVSA